MTRTRADAEQQIARDIETAGTAPVNYDLVGIADTCHAITGDWSFDSIDDGKYQQIVASHAKPASAGDDTDFDITEKIAVLPDTGTKGGHPVTTEVYYYYADDGAFISLYSDKHGLLDLKGPEAIQLGLNLIAAGRRAIELENDNPAAI